MRIASLAGLVLIAATATAQPPRVTSLAQFGCESCTGPQLFTRIQALAVSADRRIVVVDQSEPRVRIFDAAGRAERSFGRTGQGPAELQTPMGVSIAGDGNVEVVDMSRRRLIRFGARGEDGGSVALGGFANNGAFAPHGGHALATITAPGAPGLRLVRVTGDKPVDLLEVGNVDFPQRPPGNIEALSVAVAPDGSFVVGDGVGAYLIRKYRSDGTPAGEIRRAIPRVRRTPTEIRAENDRRAARMGAMRQGRMGGAPAGDHGAAPRTSLDERSWFESAALQFDEKGRLWVRAERNVPGRTVLDVFDPAGAYLGEVVIPAAFRDFALGAGILAAVVQDDLGVERVHLWTVGGAQAAR